MVGVAVGQARGRCVFRVAGHLSVSVLGCLPLPVARVVELILRVQLHVHLGLHPQPLHPAGILAVTGCGGVYGPVRLHVVGQ